MSTEIVCPDCGGVIGATEPGIKKCTCVVAPAPGARNASSESSLMGSALAPEVKKICSACGKDVTHKKRLKDDRGLYWCIDCADADNAKKQAKKLKAAGMETCPDCSRQFPEKNMREFQLTRLCPTCYKERTKLSEKEEKKRFTQKVHKNHEYQTLIRLGLVAGGLMALLLAKHLGWLPFL